MRPWSALILAVSLVGTDARAAEPAEADAPAVDAATTPTPYDEIPVEALRPQAPEQGPSDRPPTQLEEIVVTANKRSENPRELAGAVTAISKDRLAETGSSNFGDYLSLSPGVNFNSSAPGYSVITIRGVSSDTVPGLAQTAVGVYFDDIPLTDPSAPMVVPDIDAFDAARIEVLRGPQGALYGSASLGGAINYIPEAPDLYAPAFAASLAGNVTEDGGPGGSAKLMFNLPLFEDVPLFANGFGLRVSGHYTRTAGYIDNIGTDTEDANTAEIWGGRAMLGWAPTSATKLRLTGLTQRTTLDDQGYADENLGDLRKETLVPEPSFNQLDLAGLRYEQDVDWGSWAVIASYQEKEMSLALDGATALGVQSLGLRVPLKQAGGVKGYSGEIRFVSNPGRFEWLGGLFYANRDEVFNVYLNAAALDNAVTPALDLLERLGIDPPDLIADARSLFDQTAVINAPEMAAFFDGTFHITPSLKLSAGGRAYRNVVDSQIDARGVLVLPAGSTSYTRENRQTGNGFNPKISLAWQASDELMVYALYSKGYRLGGPNLVPSTPLTPTKQFYAPDGVHNYEVGTKTMWLDGSLSLDVSAFLIEWEDIPLVVMDSLGIFKYLDNAGDARVRGVEVSLVARPLEFLTARSSVTYLDARLLNDFDPNNGRPPLEAGDRLPGSPEWAVTNSLTGMWYVGDFYPMLTLIHRYEGPSATNLSFQEIQKGDYNLFDVRASLRYGSVEFVAFGKNLTNERAVMASNNYEQASGNVLALKYLNPPRSFGVELSYSFGAE